MTHNPSLPRKPLPPHTYPPVIKVAVLLVVILFVYALSTIPKILRARKDAIAAQGYIQMADKLYAISKFDKAIPLYRKGLYFNFGKDPLKLALCYLHRGDSASVYNALGILATVRMDSSRAIEVLRVLPGTYQDFITGSQLTYKKTVVSTTYSFDFDPLKQQNRKEFLRISDARMKFEDFINSNPNF